MGETPDDWELEEAELGADTPYPNLWVWILCSPAALLISLGTWMRDQRWRRQARKERKRERVNSGQ